MEKQMTESELTDALGKIFGQQAAKNGMTLGDYLISLSDAAETANLGFTPPSNTFTIPECAGDSARKIRG